VPAFLEQHKTRATAPQVRLWQELEIESGGQMPYLFDEVKAAGQGVLDERAQARLDKAVETASAAVVAYVETSRRRWAPPSKAGPSAPRPTTGS
jgi:hypothetical protein